MTLTLVTKVRRCGTRKEGSVYAVGGSGRNEEGVISSFIPIDPPIPYQVPSHRGPRIVDAFRVLDRQPIEDWWYGSSKDTEQKKNADQWALDTFGMTLHKRMSLGDCVGSKDADDALAKLVSKITDPSDVSGYIRNLTLNKLQEIPRVMPYYERLVQSIASYYAEKTIDNLVTAQAAVWRIVYNIPPSKRKDYTRNLASILAALNLKRDAMSLITTFN